jgi:hypothetical protein
MADNHTLFVFLSFFVFIVFSSFASFPPPSLPSLLCRLTSIPSPLEIEVQGEDAPLEQALEPSLVTLLPLCEEEGGREEEEGW